MKSCRLPCWVTYIVYGLYLKYIVCDVRYIYIVVVVVDFIVIQESNQIVFKSRK